MNQPITAFTDSELYVLLCDEKKVRDEAFKEIYCRYNGRIFLYCSKILGRTEQSDDAFQETFSLFLQSARADREMINLPAYLLRIARNVCLRMKQRDSYLIVSEFDESIHAPAEQFNQLENEELARIMGMALELLPDDQREALVLQAYQGMSYEEIGETMNVPISTVRNWVVRAKRKVRESLTPYWEETRK
ncbi:MAG: sigma-70 family RNA polymerase sigma factor [Candidatus Kapabacteria bacterium]|nr:sigma-70 family RNA polymerase sigma factor [Candidatus Kapabacteria bacterium]